MPLFVEIYGNMSKAKRVKARRNVKYDRMQVMANPSKLNQNFEFYPRVAFNVESTTHVAALENFVSDMLQENFSEKVCSEKTLFE